MGFLDNSGDIVLDAVLTDTGRMRLSKGDGSFKITKFALADDEINYAIYNKNHPSGSAYYDIDILQTPVLEAFTNNASSVKHTLTSISRTDLLYLPTLLMNGRVGTVADDPNVKQHSSGVHLVAVDTNTEGEVEPEANTGILRGEQVGTGEIRIRIDQGLDTTNISKEYSIDSDLLETQYIVEMDHRLGRLISRNNSSNPSVSYIDDDNIASYYLSMNTNDNMVKNLSSTDTSPIRGPRGTYLEFKIASSLELKTSTYLFDKIGITGTVTINSQACQAIDTIIKVTGMTTGATINIPVRYIKAT